VNHSGPMVFHGKEEKSGQQLRSADNDNAKLPGEPVDGRDCGKDHQEQTGDILILRLQKMADNVDSGKSVSVTLHPLARLRETVPQ
jgi:hypothetical protein